MSAPSKRALALVALAAAVLLYEGLQPGFGPPSPWWDVPVALLLAVGIAALASRHIASTLAAAALFLTPPLAAPEVVLPSDAASPPGDRDRVLITVDTWRADYAFDLPGWRVYSEAVAPSSWTLPSMDSLMRGQPVRRHRGGLPSEGGFTRPLEMTPVLAEEIDGRSAAFVCNPYLSAEFGFDRGFDTFVHADSWRERFSVFHFLRQWRKRTFGGVERQRAERDAYLVDQAIRWWESTPKGRFLWVHLLGPHEYTRTEQTVDSYAAQVEAVEGHVRRLLEAIDEDAWVVLTSDHGEALGEEGRWGHGRSFATEEVQVPLALRGPEAGEFPRQASLTDVFRFLTQGDTEALDRGREVIELGGHHREVAWALRRSGGELQDRQGPAALSGQPLSPELEAKLRELGYLQP